MIPVKESKNTFLGNELLTQNEPRKKYFQEESSDTGRVLN